MPRPIKNRRVEFIPNIKYFIPDGVPKCQLEENVLKVEELEALRLKDMEGLDQESCANRMNISRQTFYKVLLQARNKIIDSLINGKAIRIEGGNFIPYTCPIHCKKCNNEWEVTMEKLKNMNRNDYKCPHCGSTEIECAKRGKRKCCSF